jgi:hypothetical protein
MKFDKIVKSLLTFSENFQDLFSLMDEADLQICLVSHTNTPQYRINFSKEIRHGNSATTFIKKTISAQQHAKLYKSVPSR